MTLSYLRPKANQEESATISCCKRTQNCRTSIQNSTQQKQRNTDCNVLRDI